MVNFITLVRDTMDPVSAIDSITFDTDLISAAPRATPAGSTVYLGNNLIVPAHYYTRSVSVVNLYRKQYI